MFGRFTINGKGGEIKKMALITFGLLMPFLLKAQWLETNIVVGDNPFSLCYNSVNNKIYSANEDSTITVIDGATNLVITTIFAGPSFNPPQPQYPESRFFAYDSADNKVYFINGSNTVKVVDGTADTILTTIEVGSTAYALLYDSIHNKVYCANRYSDNVTVIDGANDTVIATVPAGDGPIKLAYNSINNKVYCANRSGSSGSVTVIDAQTDSVVATVPIGDYAVDLVYNSINNKIYCSSAGSLDDRITVINGVTDSVIKVIYLQYHPALLSYNLISNKVYCSTEGDSLIILDGSTDSIITKIGGICDVDLLYNSINNKVYCEKDYYKDTLLVIDGEGDSVITAISLGLGRYGRRTFAWNPLQNRIYVTNNSDSVVSVIKDITGIEVSAEIKTDQRALKIRPNPFSVSTVIHYSVSAVSAERSAVSVKVYDISGRCIKTLLNKKQASGYYSIKWDGTDNGGKKLSSGIYFICLEAGKYTGAEKIILMR